MGPNGQTREITGVGRRILARLEQKGWNQARLAKECDRSCQWATELLRHRFLTGPVIRLLCRVLDVTPLYLMPEDEA